jgi:RecA-family ATPase
MKALPDRQSVAVSGDGSLIYEAVGPEEPPYDRWKVRTFQDAMNGSTAPPWVIEDVLLADSATLVSAQPHAMKSLSLLAASLEAVVSKKVWGHFDAPSVDSVLFLETEDLPWMVEARIRGLAKGLGLEDKDTVPGFHYACVGPFDLLGEKKRIANMVDHCAPKLIVLSTLQNLLKGKDWNSQAEMQPVMAELIEMSRGCPLVLITHSPWDSRHRRAAGTVTQTANVMTAMHYKKHFDKRSRETFVDVAVDSKAGASETSFRLKLEIDPTNARDPGAVRRVLYTGAGKLTGSDKAAIIEAFEENPGSSSAEVAELVGCTPRYVQRIHREITEKE